jgi:hypothetical protein
VSIFKAPEILLPRCYQQTRRPVAETPLSKASVHSKLLRIVSVLQNNNIVYLVAKNRICFMETKMIVQ